VPNLGRPPRAPALHLSGFPGLAAPFRLPLPPDWAGRLPAVRAAERRARKAYFAALDALHLGQVNEDAVGKLHRLVADLRVGTANRAVEHLLRVFSFARRAGEPVLSAPDEPLARLTVSVPAEFWSADRERMAARLAWPLEWLRMRRYVVGKELEIDWRMLPGSAPVAPASVRARPGYFRRRLAQAA
jgi:hypothetical protein